jgi:hypothetical protein
MQPKLSHEKYAMHRFTYRHSIIKQQEMEMGLTEEFTSVFYQLAQIRNQPAFFHIFLPIMPPKLPTGKIRGHFRPKMLKL